MLVLLLPALKSSLRIIPQVKANKLEGLVPFSRPHHRRRAVFQLFVQEIGHQPVQVNLGAAANAVVAVGIKHRIELFIGGDEAVGHFGGVLEMHVVVGQAVYQEVIAAQAVGEIDGRIVVVALFVFLIGTHVAFGIDAVIPFPVGDGRHRNGGFEHVVAFEQAKAGHVATVTPPENAHAGGIYER